MRSDMLRYRAESNAAQTLALSQSKRTLRKRCLA